VKRFEGNEMSEKVTPEEQVQGSANLAALIGMKELIPSAATVTRLLRVIAERNIRLDEAALFALRDLIVSTGEITGNLDRVLTQSLQEVLAGLHERYHLSLLEVLHQIDRLNGLESSDRAQVMKQAIDRLINARETEVKAHGEIKKILAIAGGASLVVLVAAFGYKYARPKTFWEQVFEVIK
jgi:ABC-type glutathione transport system ATPase component